MFGAADSFAQRFLGTDVSGYQTSVNWPTVKKSGVLFAWTKATESTNFVSSEFVSQETGAKAEGIYIGAYHFARPSDDPNITGPASADTEAAFFWSVTSNYVKGGGTYLVPMLDWEDPRATNGHNGFFGYNASYMSAWVNEWCNTVSNYAQLSGVTIRPIIYTGTWYSNPANGYPGLTTAVTNFPSWTASYPANPNVQGGSPPSSFPWSTWNIWQYSDTNWSGGDADVLNGNTNSLNALVIGGLSVPYFLTQPINSVATNTGGSVSFSANAIGGPAPLHYQWRFNGADLSGATNGTLTLANLQTTNAGDYAIIVTNNFGSFTSRVSLLVYPPQATVFADNFETDSTTNWIVNKSSADNAVNFNFDYSTLGIPSAPHSVGGTTHGVQLKANLALTNAAAISISPTNQSFSGNYRLHFDGWINVNGPFPDGGAGSTEFLTTGIGTSGSRIEWTGAGSAADGYYFSADGDGGVSSSSTTSGDYAAYHNATLLAPSTGVYRAGNNSFARDNSDICYIGAFPSLKSAPALQKSLYSQQTGNLATGTFGFAWHDVIVSRIGNTVDWVVDGIRMATISNATFTASNVFVGFWDAFSSLTDNTNLNFGLVDNVRVEVPAIAPIITTNPLPEIVKLGTNVTFVAAASGLPTPSYQWQFNGTNISAATNSSFILANVATTNLGNYSIIASNVAGSAISASAALSLVPPTPAEFQPLLVQSDGTVQVSFNGDAYWTYTIETSTNLIDWNVLTNLTSVNGQFQFTAGTITNSPQLFYRARVISP